MPDNFTDSVHLVRHVRPDLRADQPFDVYRIGTYQKMNHRLGIVRVRASEVRGDDKSLLVRMRPCVTAMACRGGGGQ